tara:strand:- start:10866 stop:11204 length:339 start_codon:yes stop_codon:yes gene_type:complete
MQSKPQQTNFQKRILNISENVVRWSYNPWRRLSLLVIIFLVGYFLGSSIGMINGYLALADPLGAFICVLLIEISIKIRRKLSMNKMNIFIQIIDSIRIGLLYGFFTEGMKLL